MPVVEAVWEAFTGLELSVSMLRQTGEMQHSVFRSRKYIQTVRDAGGFDINQKWQIAQALSKLPTYIPHIGHGYGRSECSRTRNVALTTYDVLRLGSDCTPTRLREHFKISPESESCFCLSLKTIDWSTTGNVKSPRDCRNVGDNGNPVRHRAELFVSTKRSASRTLGEPPSIFGVR